MEIADIRKENRSFIGKICYKWLHISQKRFGITVLEYI